MRFGRRNAHWIWLAPLLFVASNVALLGLYKVVFAGRVDLLEREYQTRVKTLGDLGLERSKLADLLAQAERSRDGIEDLYRRRFAPERQRLTKVLAELQDLGQRAGLEPEARTYPEEKIEQHGLIKKSIIFSVEGTYRDLRELINLIELSDSFLVLEEVRVVNGEPNLRISLTVSTLFALRPAMPEASDEGTSSAGGGDNA